MSSVNLQEFSIPASACLEAMARNRVDHVVTVPDWVQLALHQKIEAGVPGVRLVPCCSENQVITVAAGLTLGGKRPLLMMQNQGLYNCMNTLRAVCLDAQVPLVFMVGQFGREYSNLGKPSTDSRRTMVRILEPLLKVINVPFLSLDSEKNLYRMDEAFALAHAQRTAVVLVVSAPMAWR
jgi:sulfopyruvate decarboxylase subunit alpha